MYSGLLLDAYVGTHLVRILVFDNYQRCPVPLRDLKIWLQLIEFVVNNTPCCVCFLIPVTLDNFGAEFFLKLTGFTEGNG